MIYDLVDKNNHTTQREMRMSWGRLCRYPLFINILVILNDSYKLRAKNSKITIISLLVKELLKHN